MDFDTTGPKTYVIKKSIIKEINERYSSFIPILPRLYVFNL